VHLFRGFTDSRSLQGSIPTLGTRSAADPRQEATTTTRTQTAITLVCLSCIEVYSDARLIAMGLRRSEVEM
jgi:hypothetical protein